MNAKEKDFGRKCVNLHTAHSTAHSTSLLRGDHMDTITGTLPLV